MHRPDQTRTRDPCGDCWSWTQRNQPALWRKHLKALQADNIAAARLTFNQMTAAWSAAQQPKGASPCQI